MSSKPPQKAGFINNQFQPLMYNPLYSMGSASEEVHLANTAPNFYSRNLKSLEEEEEAAGGGATTYGLEKSGARVLVDMQAAAQAQQMGGAGDHEGGIGMMKRWSSYEQEKGYSMSPLMELAANDSNNLLSRSAAVDFLPLSNNATTPYNLEAAQFGSNKYNTQDMEILRAKHPLHTSSGSVQQHLYEQIPSSLTHPSLGISASLLANFHTHTHPPPPPSSSYADHQLQLLGDHHHHHHQWNAASHPHAELLLLPGVSDHTSPALHSHSAALPSSKLDLLHASSLHDKQATLQQLPLGMGATADGGTAGGHLPSAAQMWHIDKLDMAVGLGLRDHGAAARSAAMFAQDGDPFASARHVHTQSGLSLFLQSPQQRAQTALSLDAARFSARSATGSVGVLRNSKYLKAAQQLLNEFCNVCRDEGKGSMQAAAGAQQNIWSAAGGSHAEENTNNMAGDDHAHLLHRALFSGAATQKDVSLYSNEHYKSSIDQSIHSKQFKQISDHHQLEKPHADLAAARSPSPSHLDKPPPHKQLPADERCHLQMRKARLIAMVEELDRRYQQYRDQMQLIVTSFESATGMGAAAAYTTLARKAMSRQFRGLRDVISEHIRKVCKMLGEEVSSVPILSRGETPRLRLVDQRLRHQRSLQQIGMLPQQQAWRPQRGLPERSVSVLRAWLFEHFLHPYPKDSEKSMLARLTGLSRNQVSNWFINARVRLWKPMIEEMYVEESKALEQSEAEASHAAAEVMQGISAGDQSTNISSDHCLRQSWQQAGTSAPTPTPTSSFNNPAPAISFYNNTRPLQRDDLNSFMQLHSSARANDARAHVPHAEGAASHQYPWMKGIHADHAGDIGVLTHQHDQMSLQAAAFMQGQLNASMKNGVSLTLGLQQPPPHSSYNATSIF